MSTGDPPNPTDPYAYKFFYYPTHQPTVIGGSVDLKSATVEALYEELKSRASVDKLRLLNAWSIGDILNHVRMERGSLMVVTRAAWERLSQIAMDRASEKDAKTDYSTWYNPDVD